LAPRIAVDVTVDGAVGRDDFDDDDDDDDILAMEETAYQ
jgi:hypothetical protein